MTYNIFLNGDNGSNGTNGTPGQQGGTGTVGQNAVCHWDGDDAGKGGGCFQKIAAGNVFGHEDVPQGHR